MRSLLPVRFFPPLWVTCSAWKFYYYLLSRTFLMFRDFRKRIDTYFCPIFMSFLVYPETRGRCVLQLTEMLTHHFSNYSSLVSFSLPCETTITCMIGFLDLSLIVFIRDFHFLCSYVFGKSYYPWYLRPLLNISYNSCIKFLRWEIIVIIFRKSPKFWKCFYLFFTHSTCQVFAQTVLLSGDGFCWRCLIFFGWIDFFFLSSLGLMSVCWIPRRWQSLK